MFLVLEYLNDSLFTLNKEEFLFVHCISLDFALGKGIAKQIDIRYNMKQKLYEIKKQNPNYFNNFQYGFCVVKDNIANLITKEKYWGKPTMKTMEESLISLKKYVISKNIKKIAMPKIGCGLDRLDWNNVENLIKELFFDLDVHIIICYI